MKATLGENTSEESRSLLDLSVNADWDETAADLDETDVVIDDAISAIQVSVDNG